MGGSSEFSVSHVSGLLPIPAHTRRDLSSKVRRGEPC